MIAAKKALVAEFDAALAGHLAWSTFNQRRAALEAHLGGPPNSRVSTSYGGASPDYCIPSCRDPNPRDADIYTNFYAQINYYYCGPASGQMILHAMGYNTSHDGEGLSQPELAITKYLETDKWGQTPWYVSSVDQPYPQTLNYWRTGSYNGYYVLQGAPSVSTERSDMRLDITGRYPVALNTTEQYSGYHLPGHPTDAGYFNRYGPIGHWVDNNGFHNYEWTVHYADSATSVWPDVHQFNDVNLTDINTLLQNHGMVW